MSRWDDLRAHLLDVAVGKARKPAIDAVIEEALRFIPAEPAEEVTEEGGVVTERVHDGMVQQLRVTADAIHAQAIEREFAASLLEAHDDTGINLAKWPEASAWLRRILGPDVDLPSNGA